MKFTNFIRKYRNDRNMSPREFAKMCGISQTALGYIEQERTDVHFSVAQKILNSLSAAKDLVLVMKNGELYVTDERSSIFLHREKTKNDRKMLINSIYDILNSCDMALYSDCANCDLFMSSGKQMCMAEKIANKVKDLDFIRLPRQTLLTSYEEDTDTIIKNLTNLLFDLKKKERDEHDYYYVLIENAANKLKELSGKENNEFE